MDVQTYNKVFLPQWTTASLFIRNLQLTLESKCDKESLRQLQIIGWNEETKKFISDVLNLYKEKVVNELNSCSNYEHGKHKNCPICGKQSFSASNHIFVYDEQPTTKNTKCGDVVLYANEVWMNDGNNIVNLDDYIDKDGTILKPLIKNQTDEETLKENTMENYIVINGKKAELTKEQLKQLGIEVEEKRNSPFDRVSGSESYYFISAEDNIDITSEAYIEVDQLYFDNANYFNDTDFANQVMLHQQLYRKLLKYAYDNNAEDREWDKASVNSHYFIYFDSAKGHFVVGDNHYCHSQSIYFSSENVAKQAIQDVVEPFLAEHPEFVW